MPNVGFEKWSNNDLTNLNIKGVRFGYKKPILEVELNELQDLFYTSIFNSNRVNNKPNTYMSCAGSKLSWEYEKRSESTYISLILTSTTDNDVIKLVFGGGVEYFFKPLSAGRHTLVTLSLPSASVDGTEWTAVLRAKLETVSPDPSDTNEYDEEVAYAIDSRTPNLTSTKRIMLKTGFNETDKSGNPYVELRKESYETALSRVSAQKLNGLNDPETVEFILGSWRADKSVDFGWKCVKDIYDEDAEVESLVVVNITESAGTYRADKTLEEVHRAIQENKVVLAKLNDSYYNISSDNYPNKLKFNNSDAINKNEFELTTITLTSSSVTVDTSRIESHPINSGTTDIEAGVTPLEDGSLYFVYE